jgi:D-3-phosphoglycerate dehydrogenase
MDPLLAIIADENHPCLEEELVLGGCRVIRGWYLKEEDFFSALRYAHILVLRSRFRITSAFLDRAPLLKVIGRVGSGMENIDVQAATGKGIRCLNVPEGNARAVAEHALGMLLCLLRNIHTAHQEVGKGIWKRKENRGYELSSFRAGIIGFGHTGSEFARILSSLGMPVLAYDKYKKNFSEKGIQECRLEEIFETCNLVSIHVPYTEETHYLLNKNFFNRFRNPVIIINTSRGKCLNTKDLIAALDAGKVAGACLDVHEMEDATFGSPEKSGWEELQKNLFHRKNVVLTPHIAGWTYESNYKMSKGIAKKILSVLKESK